MLKSEPISSSVRKRIKEALDHEMSRNTQDYADKLIQEAYIGYSASKNSGNSRDQAIKDAIYYVFSDDITKYKEAIQAIDPITKSLKSFWVIFGIFFLIAVPSLGYSITTDLGGDMINRLLVATMLLIGVLVTLFNTIWCQ